MYLKKFRNNRVMWKIIFLFTYRNRWDILHANFLWKRQPRILLFELQTIYNQTCNQNQSSFFKRISFDIRKMAFKAGKRNLWSVHRNNKNLIINNVFQSYNKVTYNKSLDKIRRFIFVAFWTLNYFFFKSGKMLYQ